MPTSPGSCGSCPPCVKCCSPKAWYQAAKGSCLLFLIRPWALGGGPSRQTAIGTL